MLCKNSVQSYYAGRHTYLGGATTLNLVKERQVLALGTLACLVNMHVCGEFEGDFSQGHAIQLGSWSLTAKVQWKNKENY